MTKAERQDIYINHLTPDTPMCVNCGNWHRHWRPVEPPTEYKRKDWYLGVFAPLVSGHCCYPRLKARMAYDTCEHFSKQNHRAIKLAALSDEEKGP